MRLHQTKMFLHSKGNYKHKRQPMRWDNVFTNTSDKGLISKMYTEITKLNTKNKQTTQLKHGQRT